MPKLVNKIIISASLCFLSQFCFSQVESNYWTHQYGSKGLLLNGAVIASPDGETSAFYNPGAIGMDDDLGFLFSFITPTYSDLKTTNLLGDDHIIRDRNFNFAPGFFGLRLRPFQNKNITLAISNFERYDSNIRFGDRVVAPISGSEGGAFRIDLDFNREISEKWRGIGIAYNLSDNVGIGLSQFSVWHSQKFFSSIVNEIQLRNVLDQLDQFSRIENNYRFNLNSAFITKLGFSYKTEKICFGLTYTSPLYGTINKSASYNFEDQITDSINEISVSSSNRNNTSEVTYRSPHSFGLGIDIHREATSISFSSEYFLAIDEYRIIDDLDDRFSGIATSPTETLFRVETESEAVLNFAIGLQREISESTSLVLGFRSDLSHNNSVSVNNTPDYHGVVGNIYHISGGSLININNNQFSCGFDIGFGSKKEGAQLVDLSAVRPNTFPDLGGKNNVTSRFSSYMIFITYDFIFQRFKKNGN